MALGDSYSAGEGIAPYFRTGRDGVTGGEGAAVNDCHRSSRAYSTFVRPAGYGKPLYTIASGGGRRRDAGGVAMYGSSQNVRSAGGIRWASWACSGAETGNVLPTSLGGVPQREFGRAYDRATQLDSANLAGADLITLSIGGNDAGFIQALVVCALGKCGTKVFERERRATIDALRPKLEQVYRAIAARAPRARILVLGYPQLFPATTAEQSCGGLALFAGEQPMLRRLGALLNGTIAAAARAVGGSGPDVEYVPVAARFAGHEVCGRKGAWINGIAAGVTSRSFHPSLAGQRDGYAAAVDATLRARG